MPKGSNRMVRTPSTTISAGASQMLSGLDQVVAALGESILRRRLLSLTRPVIPRKPVLAGQFLPTRPALSFPLPRFSGRGPPAAAHIAEAQFSLVPGLHPASSRRGGKGETHEYWFDWRDVFPQSALRGPGSAGGVGGVHRSAGKEHIGHTSTTDASGANSLTGSTTASLDSQTLQALLGLTQQDPANSSDPAQSGATGQTGQTQGMHHHHHDHHGGGGMQAQSTDPSASSSSSSATAAPRRRRRTRSGLRRLTAPTTRQKPRSARLCWRPDETERPAREARGRDY